VVEKCVKVCYLNECFGHFIRGAHLDQPLMPIDRKAFYQMD